MEAQLTTGISPTPETTLQTETEIVVCANYLELRNTHLGFTEPPPPPTEGEPRELFLHRLEYVPPSQENAQNLAEFTARLSPERVAKFLTDPYTYRHLQDFLAKENEDFVINPEKVDLALQTSEKIDTAANIFGYEDQFLPAIKLSCYIALEYVQNHDLPTDNPKALTIRLEQLSKVTAEKATQLERDNEQVGRGKTHIRGEKAIIRHLQHYTEQYTQQQFNESFENYLVRTMTNDIHRRLQIHNDRSAVIDQPQGYEIEVLRRVTESARAKERGTEHWLPRGIPWDNLERTDWQITSLLGIVEDFGERKFQRFEMSSDPAETATSHTSAIFALTASGFISEADLSPVYEGYSLHASTTFPLEILTEKSMAEYRRMARGLAGAYASDQRIGFGGFMSGGSEISDKTKAGTLREVVKVKDIGKKRKPTPGKALVEIRNLDITPETHFLALNAKQFLDYGFKCAGLQQLGRPLTETEVAAATAWHNHLDELTQLFQQNHISDDLDTAWRELAQVNETNPTFRNKLQEINRHTANSIRRAVESIPEETRINQELNRTHNILPELLGQMNDRIYLTEAYRKKLAVKPGDTLKVKYNNEEKKLIVAQAKVRGNHDVDRSTTWRTSPNVLSELNIPPAQQVGASYNFETHTLQLEPKKTLGETTTLIPTPRTICSEPLGEVDNRIYLTAADRENFGVEPGETIRVCVGQVTQEIVVAQSKIRPETGVPETPASGNWRLSNNLFTNLSLPENIHLKAQFDHAKKELHFGPIIGVLNRETDPDEKGVFGNRTTQLTKLSLAAREIGGLMLVIDPNASDNQTFDRGIVHGYVLNSEGQFTRISSPFPDIIYDRDVNWLASQEERFEKRLKKALGREVELSYVFPPELQELTLDKSGFNAVIETNNVLNNFIPESKELESETDLAEFFENHNEIFLKPKYGQKGEGVIRIQKTDNGYSYQYPEIFGHGWESGWEIKTGEVTDIKELFSFISGQQKERSNYLMQQYLHIAQVEIPTPKDEAPTGKRSIELRTVIQRNASRHTNVTGSVARLIDPELKGHEYEMDSLQVLIKAFGQESGSNIYNQSKRIAVGITKLFEDHIQAPVGELTIDIAVTEDGELYILEGNSKPETRGMFERVKNTDAEQAVINNPIQFAAAIKGFI